MKDSNDQDINISRVASFELEIVKFDTVLDRVQKHFPEDTRIWEFVAYARDSIFRLQQALHGVDIIDFTCAFEKPWWVDQFMEEGNKGKEVA
jgi:hypothetical protein